MKTGVSNIAWPKDCDRDALEILRKTGMRAIEIAPTRIWPAWQGITSESIQEVRRSMDSAGLSVSSLQSILFQKPELQLFGSSLRRQEMYDHLCRCGDLAAELGAGCIVFGAPKNRGRGSLPEEDAFSIAGEFLGKIGGYYAELDIYLGIEANPPEYGCDFVTDSVAAARLVRMVGSKGIGLHLDTACLQLGGESGPAAIEENIDILRHVHISEPYLGRFSAPSASHSPIADALQENRYEGWAILEMRATEPPLPPLDQAARYTQQVYGSRM